MADVVPTPLPRVQIKCLTDGITCPCLVVKKCLNVCLPGGDGMRSSTNDPNDCVKDLTVCALIGDEINFSYTVTVSNDEPTRRFFIGKITVKNTTDDSITVTEAGIRVVDDTDNKVEGTPVPVIIPCGESRDFSVEGSFEVPDGTDAPISIEAYANIEGIANPITGDPVDLDADPDCDIERWDLSDLLRFGENGIGTSITRDEVPANNITPAELFEAGGSVTFTVTLDAPIVVSDETCGTYTNIFRLTPIPDEGGGSQGPTIDSNPVTLTIQCEEIGIRVTPSSACDDYDKWCLCKKDTLIEPAEGAPCNTTLIGYVLTLTKQNDCNNCCVKVVGRVVIDNCVRGRGLRGLVVQLFKRIEDGPDELIGEVTLDAGEFDFNETDFVDTECIEGLAPGDTIYVRVTYSNLSIDVSDCDTPPEPISPRQTVDSGNVLVPSSDGTSQAILTDIIIVEGENCEEDAIVIDEVEDVPDGCACTLVNPNSSLCEASIEFTGSGEGPYTLGQDEYDDFVEALFAVGGVNLNSTALVPAGTDVIELRYFVIPPLCADSIKNNAMVMSISSDGVSSVTNTGTTETVINEAARKARNLKEAAQKNRRTVMQKNKTLNTVSAKPSTSQQAKKVIAPTPTTQGTTTKVVPVAKKAGCAACAKKKH